MGDRDCLEQASVGAAASPFWFAKRIRGAGNLLQRPVRGGAIVLEPARSRLMQENLLQKRRATGRGGALLPLLLAYRVKLHLGFIAVGHGEIDDFKAALAQ
jgi:hypothetical protein